MIAEALADLTPKEIEFVEVYLTSYNGARAWMKTFGTSSPLVAAASASRALTRVNIRTYLSKRMAAMFARTELSAEKFIIQYQYVAYADVNELVEYRREACRHCYGKGHLYQMTPQEMRDHKVNWTKAVAKVKGDNLPLPEFNELGGIGFDPRKTPHTECPECHAEGRGRVVFGDSRILSPAGQALYAGARTGKGDTEILMHSQEKAREMLARILKLFEDKTEITVGLDAQTLEDKFASKMRAAHERMAKIMEERGGMMTEM